LLFTFSNILFVNLAKANPKPYYPPEISIFSPSPNQIYNSSDVLLNVSVTIYGVTFPPWDNITSLYYSLDGKQDIPISYSRGYIHDYYGKTTLSNLSDGPHSIIIHGENTPFRVVSGGSTERTYFNATVTFTVKLPGTSVTEPFPILPVAVAPVGIVAIVGAGLLVYFKKRKRGAVVG